MTREMPRAEPNQMSSRTSAGHQVGAIGQLDLVLAPHPRSPTESMSGMRIPGKSSPLSDTRTQVLRVPSGVTDFLHQTLSGSRVRSHCFDGVWRDRFSGGA
jgi:hypothetical protein